MQMYVLLPKNITMSTERMTIKAYAEKFGFNHRYCQAVAKPGQKQTLPGVTDCDMVTGVVPYRLLTVNVEVAQLAASEKELKKLAKETAKNP